MLIAGVVLILTGCFELIRTRHMLKIIIALELAIKAVSMFLALGGWLNGSATPTPLIIIPEPMTLAVLALGGLLIRRK